MICFLRNRSKEELIVPYHSSDMPLRIILIFTLLLGMFLIPCKQSSEGGLYAQMVSQNSSLASQASGITYDFDYIAMLYERGEDEAALKEILRFEQKYPSSDYDLYINFMMADINLRKGNYSQSEKRYDQILNSPMFGKDDFEYPILLKARILFDNAQAKFMLGKLSEAEILIQRLQSEYDNPALSASAWFLRGKIQYQKELYYSAEQSFRMSLMLSESGGSEILPSVEETNFHLFKTMLALGKDTLAFEQMQNIDPKTSYYLEYLLTWLAFLVDNSRLDEFETTFNDNLPKIQETNPNSEYLNEIRLLATKAQILKVDYAKAETILKSIAKPNDYSRYYKAILLKEKMAFAEADSILSLLSDSSLPEIALLSYLERLKILYVSNPESAISQLQGFVSRESSSAIDSQPDAGKSRIYLGEQYFLLGIFYYQSKKYDQAINFLSKAKTTMLDYNKLDQINYLLADIWFKLEANEPAMTQFNRYLNLHPYGLYRDQVWYSLGVIYFNMKNYKEARSHFQRLTEEHPKSAVIMQARFYIAEIDFNLANYNSALSQYQILLESEDTSVTEKSSYENKTRILYRMSQINYYTQDYVKAHSFLDSISTSELDFEASILRGAIFFNEKKYTDALQSYQKAQTYAREDIQTREAQSYQALTLYQLRRFKEASDLYFALSGSKGSEETFLYLSAKSAFHANDYHQALKIYDQFLDQYPNSTYFVRVLNDIANIYFNLGNYDSATQTWINTIRRFTNSAPLKPDEITFVTELLTGLELGFRQGASLSLAEELIGMIDSFKSDFLRFELRFLVVKVFADRSLWQSLIQEAEVLRTKHPASQRLEIELLMAESLVNLNEYAAADTTYQSIYKYDTSPLVLKSWAELDLTTGKTNAALEKLLRVFSTNPEQDVWLKILSILSELTTADRAQSSVPLAQSQHPDFQSIYTQGLNIWFQGDANHPDIPVEAMFLKMKHHLNNEDYQTAELVADALMEKSQNALFHANAFLTKGIVQYSRSDLEEAMRSFNMLRLLFPDYTEVLSEATYYHILCLWKSGSEKEAIMMMLNNVNTLSGNRIRDLEILMGDALD